MVLTNIFGHTSRAALASAVVLGSAFGVASATSAEEAATWEGPYVGVQIASSEMTGRYEATTGSCGPCRVLNLESETTSAGGQAGYNFQAGSYVFGIEGSLVSTDISEASDQVIVGGVPGVRPEFTRSVDWTATITPRGGVLFNNTLVYAKAGWAYAKTTVGHFTSGGSVYESQEDTRTGWVVGAGVEHPFNDHLTGRIEVDHMDFGDTNSPFPLFDIDDEMEVRSVRFGLNYRF